MRWDNLRIDEERARLPGYREEAVVRHFDAPEALDTRFYEVRAKSALNRVPESSRMPFRWTINPYRGCSHACGFCESPDTPVLTADGRHRRIADLRPGDRIYGTRQVGRYRRYVITRVLAHWATLKPAFRIALEDGTELIASGDHRFLTRRGWKHVTGAEQGSLRRPHLTLGAELLGTGRFVEQPCPNAEYRAGYLSGLIRGDGHIGAAYSHRPREQWGDANRFRLALVDLEALRRASNYLELAGLATGERVFSRAVGSHRELRSIALGGRPRVEMVEWLIDWPAAPTDDWRRGFLAGIFDAEGSCSRGILRISNTGADILRWTEACFRRFGFDIAIERTSRGNGLTVLRLRGGQVERMRFFHTTDPAITRKRSFVGEALKNYARLEVVEMEPLARAMRMYDITTGTGDFISNGVVSHNCFARPTHEYLDFNAGRDFEREIVVKVNVPEVLRAELKRPSWKREHVALGTNTDPYQWVEGRYKLMRGIWEALRDIANPCSILTKSPLVLRDLDLLLEIAERTEIGASLSVPTLDEKAWRATEPRTPHPRARLEAVAELNRAGIPTGVLIAPLMPGINDSPEQVERIIELAMEAGATGISGIALHLRGSVKPLFMKWLEENRPDLLERYAELYRRGAYMPAAERQRISELVRSRTKLGPPMRLRSAQRDGAPPSWGQPGSSTAADGPTKRGRPEESAQIRLF